MDMFEPQDHPDDIPYPGATPTRPYDNAGYTLAFQMGVQFDRILDGFDGPFEKLTDFAKAPAGQIRGPQQVAGFYFSHKANDSFIATNRLLASNEDVSWCWDGPLGQGTFYVANKATTRPVLQKIATELGVNFDSAASAPTGVQAKLRKLRVGVFDTYASSGEPGMQTGWTRLLLENFEFPFEVVYPPMLDEGNLRAKYDVLVFNNYPLAAGGGGGRGGGGGAGAAAGGDTPPPAGADVAAGRAAGAGGAAAAGAAAGGGGRGQGGGRGGGQRAAGDDRPAFVDYPEEFTKRRGAISAKTTELLKAFVNEGGTIVAIGGAASSAIQVFGLPLSNHLVRADGTNIPGTDYFVPGSVLRVAVDPKNPLAHGYGNEVDIFFDNSPVWKNDSARGTAGVQLRNVAWFSSPTPLRSGWAWGQKFLDKGIQIADASVGQGRVFLFGNELLFRSQPHGNYRFFFNAMYLSVAPTIKAGAQ